MIEEAIENNCNLIIAHHPIVFSGLKKLNGKNHIERTIIKAIQNNVLTMFVPHITGVPLPDPVMLNWSKNAIKYLWGIFIN